MRRAWFPNYGEPATVDDEREPERAARQDAECELYAEQDAREYAEVMAHEADRDVRD
jgi:hypothetical protein